MHFQTSRRAALALVLGLAFGCATTGAPQADAADAYYVYIGTYTGGKDGESKGIYRFTLDAKTGEASEPVLAAEATNPSFLAVHPDGTHLYAVGEIGRFQGKSAGSVSAFTIDPASGELKPLNTQASGGSGPCHLVVDPSGRSVLVANYGGGSCAALPIGDGGQLQEASSFHQHAGSSVSPRRQKGPHAHSINTDPAGKFAFVADLGLDKILIYRLDAASGKLTPHDPPFVKAVPGGGPRHFAFHPSGKFAYTNLEMTSQVTAFSYDAAKGTLEPIHTLSTLPDDYKGNNSTAETLPGSSRSHSSQ